MDEIFIDVNFYLAKFDGEYDSSYIEYLPGMDSFIPHQRVPIGDIGWNRAAAADSLESIRVGETTTFTGKAEPAMKAIQFLLPEAELGDAFISPDGTIFHLVASYDILEYWKVVQSDLDKGIPPTRTRRVLKDIPDSKGYGLVEVRGSDRQLVDWVTEHYRGE